MNDSNLPVPVENTPVATTRSSQRWALVRDLTVFQIKLLVDGFKDLVLGPLSLVAGIIDLVRGTPRVDGLFRGTLRAGARFDRWVGLFDMVEVLDGKRALAAAPGDAPAPSVDASLDDHLRKLEQLILSQQQQGGLTAEAKQVVDRAIKLLEAQFKPPPPSNQR